MSHAILIAAWLSFCHPAGLSFWLSNQIILEMILKFSRDRKNIKNNLSVRLPQGVGRFSFGPVHFSKKTSTHSKWIWSITFLFYPKNNFLLNFLNPKIGLYGNRMKNFKTRFDIMNVSNCHQYCFRFPFQGQL